MFTFLPFIYVGVPFFTFFCWWGWAACCFGEKMGGLTRHGLRPCSVDLDPLLSCSLRPFSLLLAKLPSALNDYFCFVMNVVMLEDEYTPPWGSAGKLCHLVAMRVEWFYEFLAWVMQHENTSSSWWNTGENV